MHQDRARAESFGAVARAYDRARPAYPEALILDLAMRGPRDVLDVGCGTGKAARLLAARGLRVLGVEIDRGMAAVAREHGIDVEVTGFESWDDAGRRFDLITCGQAWHWIDPEAGAAKARRLLRPGGALALFWNLHELDPAVRSALDATYAEHAPDLPAGERHHSGAHVEKYVGGLQRAGFGDVAVRDYSWQRIYRRDEWLDLVATYSNHALLPDERRDALLAAIGGVVDRAGGAVTARYTTNLVLAAAPSG
ncbi:MAG TPA: methyltransferase domain-containing protein [Jatrophihabitans sp.]|jgi:SAM-dependent methyltransferase|uniref:methyltransferase domain-containing protein n=1 Tax=Jatrophihabitans sp. TaxID=1932789 RepID=UPI002E096C09|nr:methyltransferase domain-containing protein [Jatrophihabitans sp.]